MPEQYYHSDPHSLHTSRKETLQRCPRRFYIEYVLGLERIDRDAKGLRMGDAHAKALEVGDPDGVLIPYTPLIENAKSQHDAESLVQECQVTRIYAKRYLEIYDAPKQREVIWDLPIEGTHYRNCGTIDFVDHDANGKIYGGEDKLKAQWTENDEKSLDIDDQVTGELYGLIGMGYSPVVGLEYRVTKKSGIKQRTKRQPETWEEYLERLEVKMIEEQEDHFLSYKITRTHEELKEFAEELLFTAEYIDWMRAREADGKPTFPKSPKTCSFLGGCAHPELCMRYPDAEVLYRKREDRMIVSASPEQLNILAHGK